MIFCVHLQTNTAYCGWAAKCNASCDSGYCLWMTSLTKSLGLISSCPTELCSTLAGSCPHQRPTVHLVLSCRLLPYGPKTCHPSEFCSSSSTARAPAPFNSPPSPSVPCTAPLGGSKGGPCSPQAVALPLAQALLSKQWGLAPAPYSPHSSSQLPGKRCQTSCCPSRRLATQPAHTCALHKPTACAGTRLDRFPAG